MNFVSNDKIVTPCCDRRVQLIADGAREQCALSDAFSTALREMLEFPIGISETDNLYFCFVLFFSIFICCLQRLFVCI